MNKILCPCCGSAKFTADCKRHFIINPAEYLCCLDCLCSWEEEKHQPPTDWIPCEERLPEPFEEVLINGGDRHMGIGYVDEDNDWNVGLVNDGELDTLVSGIVYWQPLPSPPAGKDGE